MESVVVATLLGAAAVGQGANEQFGPVRPTAEPSGQIFASVVHAWEPPDEVLRKSSIPTTTNTKIIAAAMSKYFFIP
jgi:hypothetical protein